MGVPVHFRLRVDRNGCEEYLYAFHDCGECDPLGPPSGCNTCTLQFIAVQQSSRIMTVSTSVGTLDLTSNNWFIGCATPGSADNAAIATAIENYLIANGDCSTNLSVTVQLGGSCIIVNINNSSLTVFSITTTTGTYVASGCNQA